MIRNRTATDAAMFRSTSPWLLDWAARIAVAAILAQTLFFKFTWAPETRVIFADLGGRPAATATGIVELVAAILILVPRTAVWGALLALGTILGALATHLLVLGIEIVDPATGEGDGGLLFGLALAVAALSSTVLSLRRARLAGLLRRALGR